MIRVSISDELTKLAANLRFKLHEVKISFSAPNPKRPTSETLTIEKEKGMEANFQWQTYSILFTDEDMNWYIYTATLHPWGSKIEGTPEIVSSDSKWKLDRTKLVELKTEDVERMFPILKEPNLHPKTLVNYLNTHNSDKGRWYSSTEFKQFFDDEFYVVLSKNKELLNPFGKSVGVKGGKAGEKEIESATSGGFDIMQKLFRKQHEEQQEKPRKEKK